jgi:sugar O-acyltransferase (sialic acid O-acetyltransferase NeuD family)
VLDKKIILIGYSGHGFVLADTAIENQLHLIGYTDNRIVQNNPFELDYLGNERENGFFDNYSKGVKFLIGIGDNLIREKIHNLILENDRETHTLISQSAYISKTARIGNGTFVSKNVSINAFAKIGNNVILNTACVIEHDCAVGDGAHIAPGAVLAGNVFIGDRSFIGANAVVKQGVVIGKDVIVGAGSVVINDIPDGKKIVGNPSRII